MAASGSYDYTVTGTDLITEAAEILGIVESGESVTADEQTSFLRTLNLMVKQWQGQNDFAPGLKMWSRKRAYVFLAKGQSEYNLGPSGDHATLSYVTTTTTVAAAAGASTLTLASVTGMATTYAIGIELDSGVLQWTTINGAPSGLVVTLTAVTAGTVASGNRVFVYQTKLQQRPLAIFTAVLRDDQNSDSPIYPMDVYAYESLGDKTADGDPLNYYYESQLTNGKLFLDVEADDVTKVIRAVILTPIDDFDAVGNDAVYPQVWFAALANGLAKRSCTKFGKAWSQEHESNYQEALQIARNADPDTCTDYFQPGME